MATEFNDLDDLDELPLELTRAPEPITTIDTSSQVTAVRRCLHAYLVYHSGMLGDGGLDCDAIDLEAHNAETRHEEENITTPHRLISMRSLRSQLNDDQYARPTITFDIDLISKAYHLPAFINSDVEDAMASLPDTYRFNNWAHFRNCYSMFAQHLLYNYDLVMQQLVTCERNFLITANWRYEEMQNNPHYNRPEYRVTGPPESHTVDVLGALNSLNVGKIVRTRVQITHISPVRVGFL
jgi:hypothetical protein